MQSDRRSLTRLMNDPVWRVVQALSWFLVAFGLVIAVASIISGGPFESMVVATFVALLATVVWSMVFGERLFERLRPLPKNIRIKPKTSDLFVLAVPITLYLVCVAVARHSTSKQWLLGLIIFPSVMMVTRLATVLVRRLSCIHMMRPPTNRHWKREDRRRGDGGMGGVLAFLKPKPPVKSGPNERTFAEALDRRHY